MFCKSCGKQIDDDSVFCSHCGTKQSANVNEVSATTEKVVANPQTVNVNLSFGSIKPKKAQTEKIENEKYDLTYEREIETVFAGIGSLVLSIGLANFISENPQWLWLMLFFRIFASAWIVKIAERQNRDTVSWSIFTFLLPSIALIVIGFSKKLKTKPNEVVVSNSEE
ncbi:MAG: zinc ribbon domain-containing protein [Bacteroidetes bacterium]|nr:zinc ribbon domain-containing protein [Bacteroidota bacterium]